MKKIFFAATILSLITVLATGVITASSSESGAAGGGSGSSLVSGVYVDVDFNTFAEENVYGTVGVEETNDINYGILFYLRSDEIEKLYVAAELYDADNNLLTNIFTENISGSENQFKAYLDYDLENKNANYIVRFWITDENSNAISKELTIPITYEAYDIRYGYISAAEETSGINPGVSIDILDNAGQTLTFSFINKPTLNNQYMSVDSIDESAIVNKFAKFQVKSTGEITRLNYYDSIAADGVCSIFTAPSTGNKTAKCIYVDSNNTIKDNYAICALFNKGLLTDIRIKRLTDSAECFISEKECTDIKLMLWENFTTLKPMRNVSYIGLLEPQ